MTATTDGEPRARGSARIDALAPTDAEAAYRALDEHPDRWLGVCFDWTPR
jgi:hypothetical protein